MALLLGVMRHEAGLMRREEFLPLVLLYPLAIAIVMQMVIGVGQRPDLGSFAVVGPWLVGVWQLANLVAGETLNKERHAATLEPLVAAPASTIIVLTAKVGTVSLVSLLGLLEAVAVAAAFGRPVTVHHPLVLLWGGVLTLVAATATSLVLVALYVASRSARTYQNSISYPVLVLGGAIVPVSVLPEWVQPLSRLIFLSWANDLVRASFSPGPAGGVVLASLALIALTLAGGGLGGWLVHRALRRARVDGSLALA
jgi:ABC-2 type transport system permease protein